MRKFLIYAAIWIAAAASLEIGTRLFFKREPALLYANNVLNNFSAELGWFHNPNTVYRYRTRFGNTVTYRINAQGFRGPELTRDPMIKTIGVFGDSYSSGQGVGDQFAFPALLGRNLDQKQVLNTGVYDYRPSQSFRTYERVSEEWPLETIIIQLCFNDFENQETPIVRRVHKGYLNPSPPTTA